MRPTLIALAVLLAVSHGGRPRADAETAPPRLAIIGDSISQGSAGDYSWRYFAWRHLQAADAPVDFVGPEQELWDLSAGDAISSDYADPDFDQDHASRWGDALAWPQHPIGTVMADHDPDIVVIELGTNDLTFFHQTPEQTVTRVEAWIGQARAANPQVKVVVVEIVGVLVPGASEFNALLAERMPGLSTAESPVAVARAADGFVTATPSQEGDTWDPVHPDTSGQVKIAAAVCDALAELGLGAPYPRPLAVPAEGLRVPPTLSGLAGLGTVSLSWDPPPGATGHDVWTRDVTAAGAWTLTRPDVAGTAATLGLTSGHTYELRVRARKGYSVAAEDMFSNTVTLVVLPETDPEPPASPSRPAPQPAAPSQVSGVTAEPGRDSLTVSWQPVASATSYLLWVRDAGAYAGWSSTLVPAPVSAPSRTLAGLPAGSPHQVRVQAVNQVGVGLMSETVTATPGGPVPAAPKGLGAVNRGGTDVSVRWRRVADATHYVVQVRVAKPGRHWQTVDTPEPVTGPRLRVPGLSKRPYSIRVVAWHHRLEGGTSKTVRLTVR